MKNIVFLFLLGLLIFTIYSCKSNPVNPPPPPPVEGNKDPREMTWTVDTLSYSDTPQTIMYGICGISTNNIYIYGHNPSAIGSHVMHYDGEKWNALMLRNYVPYSEIYDMLAFSKDNVWFAGYGVGAKIINYNGIKYTEYWPSDAIDDELLCTAGDKPNNIYAGGRNGLVLQFTGSKWRVDNVKKAINPGTEFYLRKAAVYQDTCFFLADYLDVPNMTTKHYVIKGNYNNWVVADSITESYVTEWKWGWFGLTVTPENKLLSYGPEGIWEYSRGKWIKYFDTEDNIYHLFVLNKNYAVAVGLYGTVYYYNGSDWAKLRQFEKGYENVFYSGAWGNGKELFIIGYTPGAMPNKTYVFHGK